MFETIDIASSLRPYTLNFIESTHDTLVNTITSGDVVILDASLLKLLDVPDTINIVAIKAREEEKDFERLGNIIKEVLATGFQRNNKLIAIGGGITQDITGFLASILFRGVQWFFFPTTLLSQGDSCIGGKTSINFSSAKNLLGNFYPPSKIFIDINHLRTLPDHEICSGIGEMCHFFLVDSEDSFSDFSAHYRSALQRDMAILSRLIWKSLIIKRSFIQLDEFDKKERLILNYGHSFGHALESITSYAIPHGIAVTFGMDIANFISVQHGYLSPTTYRLVKSVLANISAGWRLPDFDTQEFIFHLKKDKKNAGRNLRLILTKGIGEMFMHEQAIDASFVNWLDSFFCTVRGN
jgi:3-dehydroquinate synthase